VPQPRRIAAPSLSRLRSASRPRSTPRRPAPTARVPCRQTHWVLRGVPGMRSLSTDFLANSGDDSIALPARRGTLSAMFVGGQAQAPARAAGRAGRGP